MYGARSSAFRLVLVAVTRFFAFRALTWPDAAAMPRHSPLIIPLAGQYSLDQLAEALEHLDQIGLLPSIPFSSRGCRSPMPEAILGNVVSNY